MLCLNLDELGKAAYANRKRKDAYSHDFELLANRVDFENLLGREIAHERAAIGNALNDTFLLQFKQGQPNITAMGIEAVAQVLLDEALARVTPTEHDVFFQAGRDHFGDRIQMRARLRKRCARRSRPRGRVCRCALMPDRSVDGHDGSKNQAGILSPATPRPAARNTPNQLFTILYTMLYTLFLQGSGSLTRRSRFPIAIGYVNRCPAIVEQCRSG